MRGTDASGDAEGGGAWSCSDSAGYYQLSGLPTGTYDIAYQVPGGSTYVSKTLSAQSVVAGQSATTNVSLTLGGSITGKVTDVSTGLPVSGAYVEATATGGSYFEAETDASGTYSIVGLATASYTVEFFASYQGGYIEQWYDHQTSSGSADPVSVTAGSTTSHVDAALDHPGSISGTVTDAGTGLPISGVYVYAYSSTDQYSSGAVTAADGTYVLTGLTTGSYTVEYSAAGYSPNYYNDQADYYSANQVAVVESQTTAHIDDQLVKMASISGTVIDSGTGLPVPSVPVFIYSGSFQFDEVTTGADGTYTFSGITPGTYTVEFAGTYEGSAYGDQWWNGATSQATATPITVTTGQQVTGIDGSLQKLGTITGTITSSVTGLPLAGVCASVTLASEIWDEISNACTDANGDYTAVGIPTGTYLVSFNDPAGNFAIQWFDGKDSPLSADPIEVITGTNTANIGAAILPAGKISGVVTDSSGDPIQGACVYADGTSSGYEDNGACTDSSGSYTIGGLLPGSYTVEFDSTGPFIGQWYNDKTYDTADTIVVVAGTTQQANAVLTRGGTVSGTVTDAVTHAPLANICVDVWDYQGDSAYGCTDSTGTYTTGGLASGTYYADFTDDSGLGYLHQTYPGTFVVHLGQDTSGIDAAMTLGGVLAGTVTDAATSLPLGNICVVPDGGQGATSCNGPQTDDNGQFSENIAPGTYTVDFVDPASAYIATSRPPPSSPGRRPRSRPPCRSVEPSPGSSATPATVHR